MMAASAIEAINTIATLTTLIQRSSESLGRISEILTRAQSEDRDLSDAEVGEIRALRRNAVSRWNEMKDVDS